MITFVCQDPIPSFLLPWLQAEEPISQKLAAIQPGVFIQCLGQGTAPATDWEQQLLQSAEPSLFRREVLLGVASEPTWYARSLISLSDYQREADFFRQLEKEPLAKLLFNNPEVQRQSCQIFSIERETELANSLPLLCWAEVDRLWARFCLYRLKAGSNFVLMEVFLPGLERCLVKNA